MICSKRGSLGKVDLNKVCVGVHSHNSWLKRGISVSKTSKILSQYASVGMISRKLFDKFPDIKNRFYTPSGYDPRIFFPRPMPSFEGEFESLLGRRSRQQPRGCQGV